MTTRVYQMYVQDPDRIEGAYDNFTILAPNFKRAMEKGEVLIDRKRRHGDFRVRPRIMKLVEDSSVDA